MGTKRERKRELERGIERERTHRIGIEREKHTESDTQRLTLEN